MRYYRLVDSRGEKRLAVEIEPGVVTEFSVPSTDVSDFPALQRAAGEAGMDADSFVRSLPGLAAALTHDLSHLLGASAGGEEGFRLTRPIDPPEVWAAGITYKTSEMERRRESNAPDVYSRVYSAPRPEIFFKATAERCVGPFEAVGIRGDSAWNVPEPELVLVLHRSKVVGYTVGNDMTSRAIEGENPLYLPQAKVYDRCCALGPCVATAETVDPDRLTIRCAILRNGAEVFSGETSTSLLARRYDDLAEWLTRHNTLPEVSALFTGTAIVPPPEFTLKPGDVVRIAIDGIGVLENDVIEV